MSGTAEQFRKQLEVFARGKGSFLDFPATLTPAERGMLHVAATELGLLHESVGSDAARHIRVTRPAADAGEGGGAGVIGGGTKFEHDAVAAIAAIRSTVWNGQLNAKNFVIGYEDRFIGLTVYRL
jgi:hypothetical protein